MEVPCKGLCGCIGLQPYCIPSHRAPHRVFMVAAFDFMLLLFFWLLMLLVLLLVKPPSPRMSGKIAAVQRCQPRVNTSELPLPS